VAEQKRHLDALRADASRSSSEIAKGLGEMSRQFRDYVIDHADVLQKMGDFTNDSRVQYFVKSSGGSSEDIAETFENLSSRGKGRAIVGPVFKELQFSFERLSESLSGYAPPIAAAA
jgi:sugar-specific transcriptional regulator TrmB